MIKSCATRIPGAHQHHLIDPDRLDQRVGDPRTRYRASDAPNPTIANRRSPWSFV